MVESADYKNTSGEKIDPKLSYVARQWVVRLSSGQITAKELRRFKLWLAEDPSHQQAYERERTFWHQLDCLEGTVVWDQQDQELLKQPGGSRSFIHAHPRWTFMTGGMVAAFLALVLVYQDIKMFLLADHHTSVGQQQTVTLPDGSLAYLNTDTAIAVTYHADERRIDLLRGEAFFEVLANRQKPFRVVAQGGVIQAVGTAFVVHAHDQQTVVTVTEGMVAVSSAANTENLVLPSVAVHQGSEPSNSQGEISQTVERFDIERAVAWVQGIIEINGLPFAQAIAELDRYQPGRIVLLADLTQTIHVSGRFTLDGLDEAIAAVAATQGLTLVRVTPYLILIF